MQESDKEFVKNVIIGFMGVIGLTFPGIITHFIYPEISWFLALFFGMLELGGLILLMLVLSNFGKLLRGK